MTDHDRLSALEKRLSVIEDKAAIQSVMNRYCTTADRKDWNAWKQLWTEDSTFEFAGFGKIKGRDAFAQAVDDAEAPYQAMQHSNFNLEVDLHGDTADAEATVLFAGVPDSSDPTKCFVFGGAYKFKYIKSAEYGWRISEMKLVMLWSMGDAEKNVFD